MVQNVIRQIVKDKIGLVEYTRGFRFVVNIDDKGNSYVELRMYDFLTMPLTDEEVLEGVGNEGKSIKPDYPYQTSSQ